MSVPSVHIAKDRLRNLLIADRLMCTPDMSERMTSDIYYTISKYIELKPGSGSDRDNTFRYTY